MDDMPEDCAIRIAWEDLTVEITCPPRMLTEALGQAGNELLRRLNEAIVAQGEAALTRQDDVPD